MMKEINYLEEVKKRILDPRRDALVEVLVHFIVTSSKSIIKESARDLYQLKVVKFEFDQPFTFRYVAYSGCNLIPSELTNTIVDNLEIEDAEYGELEAIFEELGFENSDDVEWFNEVTSEFFNEHDLCRNMECLWFHECWLLAKKSALLSLDVRCFFIEHDDFSGIDANSGRFMTEEEIKNSLAADGLFTASVYETKYTVHKNDRVEGWGTLLKTFTDFELALHHLNTLANKSGTANAAAIYLMRKWLKMPNEQEGRYIWVIDTKFGKRFLSEDEMASFAVTTEREKEYHIKQPEIDETDDAVAVSTFEEKIGKEVAEDKNDTVGQFKKAIGDEAFEDKRVDKKWWEFWK